MVAEYGAQRIYQGQLAVLGKKDGADVVKEMLEQEQGHLRKMEELLVARRGRPSLLSPLWHVGGYALGAATAMLGKEAAMACTVAVEQEIVDHYNSQLRELAKMMPNKQEQEERQEEGQEEEEKELRQILAKFRDDEMQHMQEAEREGAASAPAYPALVFGIRALTRLAVKIAEKV